MGSKSCSTNTKGYLIWVALFSVTSAGASTPAQIAFQNGQRYSALSIEALNKIGPEADKLEPPSCPAVPLECEFIQGHFSVVLKETANARDVQLLLIRSEAAKRLAIDSYSKLRQFPESAELHRFQAQIERNRERYKASTGELRKALRMSPGDKGIEVELAGSLFLEQDYQAVLPELQRLASLNPQSAKLQFFVGHSLLEAQQIEESIPYLAKALKLDPRLTPAEVSLGLGLARLGRFEDAIPHLKAALPLDRDGTLYYQLSRAYQATREPHLAQDMLAEYEKRRPH